MATYKTDVPLVSATKFDVGSQAIDDGAAAYGTAVNAGTGDWVLGSALPKCRKIGVYVRTEALTSTPTFLKVALFGSATDANGTSGAEITSTVTEIATPAADTLYGPYEIDAAAVSDLTKYYSLGLTSNGAGSTSVVAGTISFQIDPLYKS